MGANPNKPKNVIPFGDGKEATKAAAWLRDLEPPPHKAVTADGKPVFGRRLYWDTASPLIVKVTSNGVKSFMVHYVARDTGQARWHVFARFPRDGGVADARKEARAIRERVRAGADPVAENRAGRAEAKKRRRALTFKKLAAQYVAANAEMDSVRDGDWKRIIDREFIPRIGRKLAAEVTRDDAADIVAAVAEVKGRRGGPGAAQQVKAVGSAVYAWAEGKRKTSGNPFAGIAVARRDKGAAAPGRRRSTNGKRRRKFSIEEIAAIWDAASLLPEAEVGAVIKIMLLTGARLNEIAKADWSEVKGEWLHIPPARTKTDEEHLIWLCPEARRLIGARRPGRVFPRATVHRLRAGWKAVEDATGVEAADPVEGAEMEDSRRTFRSHIVDRGIADELLAERLLNHKLPGIMGTYGRENLTERRKAALKAWGDYLLTEVVGKIRRLKGRK